MEDIRLRFAYDPEGTKQTGVLLTLKDFNRIINDLENYHDYMDVVKLRNKKYKRTYTDEEITQILNKKR